MVEAPIYAERRLSKLVVEAPAFMRGEERFSAGNAKSRFRRLPEEVEKFTIRGLPFGKTGQK